MEQFTKADLLSYLGTSTARGCQLLCSDPPSPYLTYMYADTRRAYMYCRLQGRAGAKDGLEGQYTKADPGYKQSQVVPTRDVEMPPAQQVVPSSSGIGSRKLAEP